MVIGLVEVHTHDLEGNLLGIEHAKNIMFDDARVSMLLNPCIIDQPDYFGIYYSEFKEKVNSSYYYWDSSVISRYLTTSLTLSGPDYLDNYTRMYTFTSPASLPGSTARTLRVLGIAEYSASSISDTYFTRYSTAVTLNNPVVHDTTTYVTVYYKLILGLNKESELYGNIYNWYKRRYQTVATYRYFKGMCSSDTYPLTTYAGNLNSVAAGPTLLTHAVEDNLTLTNRRQSAYLTQSINNSYNTPRMFGMKVKEGITPVSFSRKTSPSKSRTFLHAAGSIDFYGNPNSPKPTSKGSINIGGKLEDFDYPTVVCIDVSKSGAVKESEYSVTLYNCAIDNNVRTTKYVKNFLSYVSSNVDYIYYVNMYYSNNRHWGVYFNSVYNTLYAYYKGVTRSIDTGSSFSQGVGVITNTGVCFYAKSSNILYRYDCNRTFEVGYGIESLTIPDNIQSYHIDEDSKQLIMMCRRSTSTLELVVNGSFESGVNGWSAGPGITIAADGYGYWGDSGWVEVKQLKTTAVSGSTLASRYIYQDIPTEVEVPYTIKATCNIPYKIEANSTLVASGTGALSGSITGSSTTTRLKLTLTNSATNALIDDISFAGTYEGSIVKTDFDGKNLTTYTRSHPMFSNLPISSFYFTISSSRWYWRAGKGKVVWLSLSNKIHYWDGNSPVVLFTETITGSVYDINVNDDFTQIMYVVQNGSSATWIVRSIQSQNMWNLLYSSTKTIPSSEGSSDITTSASCFVDSNYMYMFCSKVGWGYRLNLIYLTEEPYLIYLDTYFQTNDRCSQVTRRILSNLPNRSVIEGMLMCNIRNSGYYCYNYSGYYIIGESFNYQMLELSAAQYGWDGTKWVLGHAGKKKTHYDAQPLPIAGTLAFGKEGENTENYVAGEYFTVGINPAGYVFDNSMSTSMNAWVYAGVPQYKEETFLINPPVSGTISTVTLTAALHPDWLCVEDSGGYFTAVFDTGMTGNRVGSTSYLSYFGEYYVEPSTGVISFHSSCANHTVTLKYYWVRRDV